MLHAIGSFGLFTYVFKPTPELVRSIGLAVVAVVLQVLERTDPAAFTDAQTYLVALGVGIGHALLALALGKATQ